MNDTNSRVTLDLSESVWSSFHLIAPLFLIGTVEENGEQDFAPKHMAGPMGWDNYFGFVCSPSHATYQNILREKVFTVNCPSPDQVVLASLSATGRSDDGSKGVVAALPTYLATKVQGRCLADAYFALECSLLKVVDGFGEGRLIIGKIEAAHVHANALLENEINGREHVHEYPLLAFIAPDRFASVRESFAFPFPKDFRK